MIYRSILARFGSLLLGLSLLNSLFLANTQAEEANTPAAAAATAASEIEYFEKQIRPVLHKHCYACHSADAKVLQGGLRVDSRSHLLTGGDSGPAIVPGKADESLLIESIRFQGDSYDMPPAGKMPDRDIRLLEDWVARGAPFPSADDQGVAPQKQVDFAAGKQFWSFQPLAPQPLPTLADNNQATGRIDPFILDRLRKEQLSPSPEADRTTLIRRLSFDLIGLPPTPAEVEEFYNDPAPDAYARLVERLLASPHYGERWGRLWLDLARYSDSTESWLGNTTQAHLYRDWVIQAFNADLPYDQFVRRQLATDLLDETGLEDLPALGFLGLSPTYFKELLLPPDIIKVIVADEWEERVDAVSRTFLGLTVACARCHDHKFDPISHEDYHALAGVFASTRMTQRPMLPEAEYAPVAAAKAEVEELTETLKQLRKKKPKPDEEIAAAEARIKHLEASTPQYHTPMAHVVSDESLSVVLAGDDPQSGTKLVYQPEPQNLNLFIRGNPNRLGPVIERRFLTVLSPDTPTPFRQGSGRLELAEAILNEAGPLTARVIVNRIWQGHFGRGLVDTPSNFGRLGSPPSHPELLEDLTARFVENGWSIKWLHREILLSATYRQSSQLNEQQQAIDPKNVWLWRMNRKRLEIEPWRDAMLAVSGLLDRSPGGPAEELDEVKNHRRTVYSKVHRREVTKTLLMHDFPDPGLHSPIRLQTTTPLQGLYVLNSPFVTAQAQALANRLQQSQAVSQDARIDEAHRLLFSRAATPAELQLAHEFLNSVPAANSSTSSTAAVTTATETAQPDSAQPHTAESQSDGLQSAWVQYCHALLGSNEFLFVD